MASDDVKGNNILLPKPLYISLFTFPQPLSLAEREGMIHLLQKLSLSESERLLLLQLSAKATYLLSLNRLSLNTQPSAARTASSISLIPHQREPERNASSPENSAGERSAQHGGFRDPRDNHGGRRGNGRERDRNSNSANSQPQRVRAVARHAPRDVNPYSCGMLGCWYHEPNPRKHDHKEDARYRWPRGIRRPTALEVATADARLRAEEKAPAATATQPEPSTAATSEAAVSNSTNAAEAKRLDQQAGEGKEEKKSDSTSGEATPPRTGGKAARYATTPSSPAATQQGPKRPRPPVTPPPVLVSITASVSVPVSSSANTATATAESATTLVSTAASSAQASSSSTASPTSHAV
jgi:hypothetical protein